jgi:type VI secretion system secreted protein Hcp
MKRAIVAAALAAAVASPAAFADEMFLKFSPPFAAAEIIGDSTDKSHPGEIVLTSYTLGVTAESSWTKGGGASVGKPNPGELQFTMDVNRSLPAILHHITTGKAAVKAVLTVRNDAAGNKAGFEYVKYAFEGMFFTSVGQGLNGAGRAVGAVSAVYKTFRMETFAPGSPTPVSCIYWNIPEGTATDCVADNR